MSSPSRDADAPTEGLAAALRERYRAVSTDRYKRQSNNGNAYPIVHKPVTESLFRAHVTGEETIAAFFVDEAGMTAIGELDLDVDKIRPDMDVVARATHRVIATLHEIGIPYLASTSGRRGYHLTIFLPSDDRLPAQTMRAALEAVVERSGVRGPDIIVEVYPKAGSVREGDTKLPCGIHRATGQYAAPVDMDLRPLPRDQWARALCAVGDADATLLRTLAMEPPRNLPDTAPAGMAERHTEQQFTTLLTMCPRMDEILGNRQRSYDEWIGALHAAARFDGDEPRQWAEGMTARYFDTSETTRRRDRKAVERIFAGRSVTPTCRKLGCPGAGKRCGFAKKDGKEPTPLRHLATQQKRRRIRVDPVFHPPTPRGGQSVEAARQEMTAQVRTFFADGNNVGHVLPVLSPPGTGKSRMLREGGVVKGERLDIVTVRHAPFEETAHEWERQGFRHLYGRNETNCRSFDNYRRHREKGKAYCPEMCQHKQRCQAVDGYLAQFIDLDGLAGTIATIPHWREAKVPNSSAVAFDDVAVQDLISRVSLSRSQLADIANDDDLPDDDHRFALLLRDALSDGVKDSGILGHLVRGAERGGWRLTETLRRVSTRNYDLRRIAEAISEHQRIGHERTDAIGPITMSSDAIAAYRPLRWPEAMHEQRIVMLGASLNVDLLRAVLPDDLVIAEPITADVAWDKNVEVIQYADSWLGATDAKAMLGRGHPETVRRKQQHLTEIVAAIHRHAHDLNVAHRDIGVITFKELEAEIRERIETSHSVHFGAVASSNTLENVPLLAVVGTYQPPLADVQRRAAALWPDLRKEEVETTHQFIPFPGTDLSAKAVTFRGARPQMLLQALREEEMYQAVHRLRPHLPDVAPRRILIFSSLPIPRIPADVQFVDEELDAHVAHIRAGAGALRALRAGGCEPAQADVLRRMRGDGCDLNRGRLDRIWDEIHDAAGPTAEQGGADARGGIRNDIPPRTTAPPAMRGLATANAQSGERAYRAALRTIEDLDAEGIPVTAASVARGLGIKKANKGVRRAVAERSPPAARIIGA